MADQDKVFLVAGVIAEKFIQVCEVLVGGSFVATSIFYLYGRYKGHKHPEKKAYGPGLLWGLVLGAIILAADAIWG